jgi:hypothetical protein
MQKKQVSLMILDPSYPVYVELLNTDSWKMLHNDTISSFYIPMKKHNSLCSNSIDNLKLEKEIFTTRAIKNNKV